MRTTTTTTAAALAAATVVLLALTGCGSDDNADPAACKTAVAERLGDAAAAGDKAEQGRPPAACEGVDDGTLRRITAEVVNERAGGAAKDATESASPAPSTPRISAECRAWIEGELNDGSDSIEATEGRAACAGLTSEEMHQAIEDTYDALVAEQDATATP